MNEYEDILSASKDKVIRDELDHRLSVELIINEGLDTAVSKGWISQSEADDWLSEYITKRNAAASISDKNNPTL